METPPGFNLDQAITAWRDELARQPGLTPADLRELEAHLRDGFAELRKNSIREEEAFLLARLRVGQPKPVAEEFVKAAPRRLWSWWIFGATFAAVFGVFAAHAFSASPEYLARASIELYHPETPATPLSADELDRLREFNRPPRDLESRHVALRIAEMLSPAERQAFLAPFALPDPAQAQLNFVNLVDRLQQQIMVVPMRGTDIIMVDVNHPDPHLAVIVANDFARAFVQTENHNPQWTAKGGSFRIMAEAVGNVNQSELKIALLLIWGFICGLLAASAAAALMRLVGPIRFRLPQVKLAS